ncbi:MAG TPA: ABC transporter permease [Myxococcaceae bacterium]|nr:ABC transporter permease [Myxococcaceae bacterium]
MNEHIDAPEEVESLGEVVQQELEAMLPFTAKVRRAIEQLGEVAVLLARTAVRAVQPPFSLGAIAYQVEVLGLRSMSIVSLTALFAGLVLSLQFAFSMARFGIQHTVGKVVSLSIFRELGPVLMALTVGARIGSGIAAELGSMKVTEQIDAIRALGADPIKKLAVPRIVACILVLPAVAIFADIFALVAGAAVVKVEYQIPFEQFYRSAIETVKWDDFGSGIMKSAVFGVIIAAVGCYQGFQVEGGTEGVGRATTETVAISSVAVCLADFFLTKLFLSL